MAQQHLWTTLTAALAIANCVVTALDLACPDVPGERVTFSIDEPSTVVTIPSVSGLCLLTVTTADGQQQIPVARSYNGGLWERAGGRYAATLDPWTCDDAAVCAATLPVNTAHYVLETRIVTPTSWKADITRFLEYASFGANQETIDDFAGFPEYIDTQIQQTPPTFLREVYRRQLNPIWRFDKPGFAARSDPCQTNSVWTRRALNAKDAQKVLDIRRVGDRWELSIDGHVRTMVPQLEFESRRFTITDGAFPICSGSQGLQRGDYRLRVDGSCRSVKAEQLVIDFPTAPTTGTSVLEGTVGPLRNANQWKALPDGNYLRAGGLQAVRCQSIPVDDSTTIRPPIFIRTNAGEWLQFVPQAEVLENTLASPIADGGHQLWAAGRTEQCAAVPRSIFNEDSCVLSDRLACSAVTQSPADAVVGTVVCGSPNEVANDPSLGDSYLDIASISNAALSVDLGLPRDTTPTGNQREYIWSQVALTAPDQLRQRVAWALFQIFALPKVSIRGQNTSTESFLVYYDILIRHAFGNYRDILLEMTFNPLMAESLSFLRSASIGLLFARTGNLSYPDENYAREIMQLFTIGLIELNNDGTEVVGPDGQPVETYGSNNILSFARVWTGFDVEYRRGNIERPFFSNTIDPMKIIPSRRDKFPKIDLSGGYLGDGYPLCSDLPERMFLRTGAKYRLLGTSPVVEMEELAPDALIGGLQLEVKEGTSGLFEALCGGTSLASCTFPSVVVLDTDMECDVTYAECMIDHALVIQVGEVFYEYTPTIACTRFSFYNNGLKAGSLRRNSQSVCLNPDSHAAGTACCIPDTIPRMQIASPVCSYAGERVSFATAEVRCEDMGMEVCDYRQLIEVDDCPRLHFHWTDRPCSVFVKVNLNGEVAIVHDTSNPHPFVAESSPSYFEIHWENGAFPSHAEDCRGVCSVVANEQACLCEVEIVDTPVFTTLPRSRWAVLQNLELGYPEQALLDSSISGADSGNGFVVFDASGGCCDSSTVFEVVDESGQTVLRRNLKSMVKIVGTSAQFRNPPAFNSLDHNGVDEALHETNALIDHLFRHKNTAPFVGKLLIQRFGTSNPSPRYVQAVAGAFRNGQYNFGGTSFGSGEYGDLASTVAAVLLHRERRLTMLDSDPFAGSLREPLLKVIGFMRAMEFSSSGPLVELDMLDAKIGQMSFEQKSVFSFFRPQYAPPETSRLQLSAPESEVMSSGRVIGLLNGLFALVEDGLTGCRTGLGLQCRAASGFLRRLPSNSSAISDTIEEYSELLTSGRLEADKQSTISRLVEDGDLSSQFSRALRLILTSPEFHATNKADVSAAERSDQSGSGSSSEATSYKAVIHLAFRGGCDSFNVLVPHPSCNLNQEYKEARGDLALGDADLLDIRGDTSGQPCSRFGIHNSLPFLKTLYDEGNLAFLANIGVLTEPVDKTNFRELTLTRLFAHDAMQAEVDSLDPLESNVGTGTLGRLADVLEQKGFATGRTAIEASADNLFGATSNPAPIFTLDENGVELLDIDVSSPITAALVSEVNGALSGSQTGIFGSLWSSELSKALNQTESIYYILQQATAQTQTNFTDTSLGNRFKLISQLIAAREERRVERDFFFVTIGGWDMHAEVTEALKENLDIVNDAIEDLVAELKLTGIFDDVTIIQTSEFGRTLSANSGGGSDHGYGGNYFMAGGSVRGRRIVGNYPSSLVDGSELNIGRGRILPTTPFDSPFHGVSQWMGATSNEELQSVLPNMGNFDELYSAQDLFV